MHTIKIRLPTCPLILNQFFILIMSIMSECSYRIEKLQSEKY